MLEARAHHQLKALLQQGGEPRWPHHLTLSRLVARSLRRGDQTLVRLAPGSDPSWLLGLLVPLALHQQPVAMVVSAAPAAAVAAGGAAPARGRGPHLALLGRRAAAPGRPAVAAAAPPAGAGVARRQPC